MIFSSFKIQDVLKSGRYPGLFLFTLSSFFSNFNSFLKFFNPPLEVLSSVNQAGLFDLTKNNLGDIGDQVKGEKSNHWESHDFSSGFVQDKICEANQMVGYKTYKDLIKLLPKVINMTVRFEPTNIDGHEYTHKVGAEDLKVPELLEINQRGWEDHYPHHADEWLH